MGLSLFEMIQKKSDLFADIDGIVFKCPDALYKRFPKAPLAIPAPVDVETICKHLVFTAGDLRTIYNSTDEFQRFFKFWFDCNSRRWDMVYQTMCFDYDPIINYDRTEKWEDVTTDESSSEDERTVNVEENTSGNTTESENGKDSASFSENVVSEVGESESVTDAATVESTESATANNEDSTASNKTATEKVAAFDSVSMVDRNVTSEIDESKNTGYSETERNTNSETNRTETRNKDGNSTTDRSGTNNGTNERTRKASGTNERSGETIDTASRHNTSRHNNVKTGRAYGNIGVTTTQEMIEAERKLLKLNFLEMIENEYKKQFCILVY